MDDYITRLPGGKIITKADIIKDLGIIDSEGDAVHLILNFMVCRGLLQRTSFNLGANKDVIRGIKGRGHKYLRVNLEPCYSLCFLDKKNRTRVNCSNSSWELIIADDEKSTINKRYEEENKMVEVPETGGAYFKADEFAVGQTVPIRIVGEGELREQNYKGQTYKQLVIPIRYLSLGGHEREVKFSLNTKNMAALRQALGGDTLSWVGRSAEVLVVPNEQSMNKKGLMVVRGV